MSHYLSPSCCLSVNRSKPSRIARAKYLAGIKKEGSATWPVFTTIAALALQCFCSHTSHLVTVGGPFSLYHLYCSLELSLLLLGQINLFTRFKSYLKTHLFRVCYCSYNVHDFSSSASYFKLFNMLSNHFSFFSQSYLNLYTLRNVFLSVITNVIYKRYIEL